ncbi:MAG: hypothetical protein QW594_01495 [Candidatus Woesearchaeota archaeon]
MEPKKQQREKEKNKKPKPNPEKSIRKMVAKKKATSQKIELKQENKPEAKTKAKKVENIPSKQAIAAFQKRVLSWYQKNKRDFPWRKTTDPYAILVSEIMLQQTQASRVIPYVNRFLEQFPTVQSLAKAKKSQLLQLWSGLGFNARALRLHQAAQMICTKHKGKIPPNEQALLALPGIGKYTARAILAFGFNQPVAVIDTNIRRVLLATFKLPETISHKNLEHIALACIPKGQSRLWHNALMDYGALHITAKKTGIKSISKQSVFKDSPRYVRGQILKLLLGKRTEKEEKETEGKKGKKTRQASQKRGILKNKKESQEGKKIFLDQRNNQKKKKAISIKTISLIFHRNDLYQILASMEKDGLIVIKKQRIELP